MFLYFLAQDIISFKREDGDIYAKRVIGIVVAVVVIASVIVVLVRRRKNI